MAENENVQLKREEVVDQEVVLSDIFPNTNTDSILDDRTGGSLSRTLDTILNAINNKLARVVNSVNGRTGVVVLDKGDVNLDNVDNVSFDDIKRWVLEQMRNAFDKHAIKLFNNMREAEEFARNHDESYSGTGFYAERGFVDASLDYIDERSYIGYFEYSELDHELKMYYRIIDTVGGTDNSIIYNTFIAGKGDFRGGKLGVNIWRYEDALHLYENAGGQTATESSLVSDGLCIDKNKIAPALYAFEGCYGTGETTDPDAFLYFDGTYPPNAVGITIILNGYTLCSSSNTFTKQQFKINDLILCSFDDVNYYESNGDLKSGINANLIKRQPAIGKVVQAPSLATPNVSYIVQFFTIKPMTGGGLKYESHKTYSGATPDNMLSVSHLQGSPLENPEEVDMYDASGLVSFNDNARTATSGKPQVAYNMSTPIGVRQMIHGDANSGLAVNPASALCVSPSDQAHMPVDNIPLKAPTNTNGVGKHVGGYLDINLIKDLFSYTPENSNDAEVIKAQNISGLRINKSEEELNAAWFGNPDLNDTVIRNHSGGLSVNVGDFLEIGKSVLDLIPEIPETDETYYNAGKVNVRIDGTTLTNVGANKLGVQLSHYTDFRGVDLNTTLGGGLIYTDGYEQIGSPLHISPGVAINRGLGLRMSHYDRFGVVPPIYNYTLVTEEPIPFDPTQFYKHIVDTDAYIPGEAGDVWAVDTWYVQSLNEIDDRGFLAVSVFDKNYTKEDFGITEPEIEEQKKGYGGLRYMISDSSNTHQVSAIGLRVNELDADYGHELRLGSRAIGISEDNIVGVQLYREYSSPSSDVNPLNIKSWNEFSLYKYLNMPWLTNTVTANTKNDLINGIFEDVKPMYEYVHWTQAGDKVVVLNPDGVTGNWAGPGTYYKKVRHGDSEPYTYTYDPITVTGAAPPYDPPWTYDEYSEVWGYLNTQTDYTHRTDTVYLVKTDTVGDVETSQRYIWDPNANPPEDPEADPPVGAYVPMFEYYNVDVTDPIGGHGSPPDDGNESKAYVVYVVDNELHTIIGKLYQWKDANRVELPMSYDSSTGTYDEDNPRVNAITASAILTYYTALSTQHSEGYFHNGVFYTNQSHTNIMSPMIDMIYEDLTYPVPHMLYKYTNSGYIPLPLQNKPDYVREDLVPYDLNKDGHINAVDASIALSFYSAMQTDHGAIWPDSFRNKIPAPTHREFLSYYLKTVVGVDVRDAGGYVTMRATDPDGSFIPGLDIDVNEYQGLTKIMNGDIKKTIGIKIYDQSAGLNLTTTKSGGTGESSSGRRGGLRFTTDGYLAVRVNELNSYDATTQDGRSGTDIQCPRYSDALLPIKTGAKGLMVYPNNVLGVQLSTDPNMELDNGELAFDEFGSLHISPSYSGGGGGGGYGQALTFTDTASHTITYNGSQPITINLGPGLIIEDDSTST